MGRFDPLLDAVVDVISERVPDFDREVIEDLIEAVGPNELLLAILGPAVDQVMRRIGLDNSVEPGEDAANKAIEDAVKQDNQVQVQVAVCECPHCSHTFMTTLQSIVNRESGKCPHCNKEIVPEPAKPKNPSEPEKGGP
jgi:predicted Zn-ribbon and HTH transcriptional regulator